jgi:putative hemolysin
MMSTSTIIIGIIAIVLLLSFSAFFSGSETALMAISRIRLKHLAKTKPRRAKLIEDMLHKPDRLIGTILLGNNLVNVAMSAIATAIAITLWGDKGIAYVTGILTFAILVFAEITPKVYAKYFNERVSLITAPILRAIMLVINPITITVTFIANKFLLVLGIDVSRIKRPVLTEEEVKTCIQIGWDDGQITLSEKEMLSRIFTLNDKTVEEVMISKEKMTTLDVDWPTEKVLQTVLKSGYSRFPVNRGKGTDIIGFIHAKDILRYFDSKKSFSLDKIIRPPFFIEEDKKIDKQLRNFQAEKIHQAVVLDTDGHVKGLITMEDILEELVGSIEDEYDRKQA